MGLLSAGCRFRLEKSQPVDAKRPPPGSSRAGRAEAELARRAVGARSHLMQSGTHRIQRNKIVLGRERIVVRRSFQERSTSLADIAEVKLPQFRV